MLDHKKFLFAKTKRVMDTRQCLGILELVSVTSPEGLKRAYRDMVRIRHPNRFHGDPRLEKPANAKLQEFSWLSSTLEDNRVYPWDQA